MTTSHAPEDTAYLELLHANHDEPVLLEMEERARDLSFPIVGRLCGAFLEIMALAVAARRVFEFGSGFGYSAYWFTRAVGEEGEVICTEDDEENVRLAEDFLTRVDRWPTTTFHCGWAQEIFPAIEGDFDVIYNDANKEGYPEIWEMARSRIRPGGLYIADNAFLHGRALMPEGDDETGRVMNRHNALVAEDPAFDHFIYPVRDGVLVARRKT